jgi:L-asparaginase
MTIRILVIGGTFDKEYNELSGELYFKNSHVSEMLTLGRSRIPVDIRNLMMVDSTTITDEDREIIAINSKKANEDRILITHGTDTMVKTAKHIAKKVKDKTIVLTGAMIPYTFGSSDGLFNLGSALAYVQILPKGVYIVMNGRYFNYDNVRKNKKTGEFEEIN